ncbi:MAG: hypothetical protein AABY07_00835 [Nanoarchaeota archaeon]
MTLEKFQETQQVQTRSEVTGLQYFDTVNAALIHAEEDRTVEKISLVFGKERVVLYREIGQGGENWVLAPFWLSG